MIDKIFKLLNRILAWCCMISISVYLPVMSYREITIPLTDRAIIIGIIGLFAYLVSKED